MADSYFDAVEDFDKNVPVEPILGIVDDLPIDSDLVRKANEEMEVEHTGVIKAGDVGQFVETVDFAQLDKSASIDSSNLIFEQLDEKMIVNIGKRSDYLIDDQLKIKLEEEEEKAKRNRLEAFYISKGELEGIIQDNPGIQIYRRNDSGEIEEYHPADGETSIPLAMDLDGLSDDEFIEIGIPVGKKDPKFYERNKVTNDDYPDDDMGFDGDEYDENGYITDEESERRTKQSNLLKTLSGIQDVIDGINGHNEYKNPDELFLEFLQNNFKDYLLAKKITGNNQTKYADKVLHSELISEDAENVEVADLVHNIDSEIKRTSVFINRNEDMEIESIEVMCKCGERTIIKFDEVDDIIASDSKSVYEGGGQTEVVVDATYVNKMSYLDDVNKLVKEEEKLVEEEIEDLSEVEEDY